MTTTFKEVIVVEGHHDAARIRQIFHSADIVTTNGSEMALETLELLNQLNKSRGLILLLDPDYPGQRIRNTINAYVGETKHVFIDKKFCVDHRKNKVGIEHASLAILKEALLEHIREVKPQQSPITMQDLVALKLMGTTHSKENRKKVSKHFHLGECNAKTLLKRLNMFAITKNEIEKVIL